MLWLASHLPARACHWACLEAILLLLPRHAPNRRCGVATGVTRCYCPLQSPNHVDEVNPCLPCSLSCWPGNSSHHTALGAQQHVVFPHRCCGHRARARCRCRCSRCSRCRCIPSPISSMPRLRCVQHGLRRVYQSQERQGQGRSAALGIHGVQLPAWRRLQLAGQ